MFEHTGTQTVARRVISRAYGEIETARGIAGPAPSAPLDEDARDDVVPPGADDHARLGAEEARRRGASDRVVALIARHHDDPVTGEERMLHEADREALP